MARRVLSVNEQLIVDNVSIVDYYNQFIASKRGYRKISEQKPAGICPFHADTDPSFHFWKEKKMFYCFGCHTAGNVIRMHILWEQTENKRYIDNKVAVIELSKLFNITLIEDDSGNIASESIFDIAKRVYSPEQYDVNIYNPKDLTLAGFRTFNNQLKQRIKNNPYVTGEQAVRLYETLDLTLSASLASKK